MNAVATLVLVFVVGIIRRNIRHFGADSFASLKYSILCATRLARGAQSAHAKAAPTAKKGKWAQTPPGRHAFCLAS